ncbi:hypothetical protein [Bradyrhizobium sp.]
MPSSIAIGQAAGLAAAMIAVANVVAKVSPVERVQAKLRASNADLG